MHAAYDPTAVRCRAADQEARPSEPTSQLSSSIHFQHLSKTKLEIGSTRPDEKSVLMQKAVIPRAVHT